MRNKQRKIKNRKRIVKELEIIRRRFIIVVLLIIALILISIIGKTIATEETIEPISENVSMVKSSDNIWVPVPKGYSASKIPEETSVNGGFVIYEGEDIDWSFLENASDVSTLDLNPEDENLVEKSETLNSSNEVIYGEDDNLNENSAADIVQDVDNTETNNSSNSSSIIDSEEKVEENNTNINEETETQERILTSAIKHTYMSNELLEDDEELKNDDSIVEQTENKNDLINDEYNKETDLGNEDLINNDNNNLENNDLLEEPKENENNIISKENEKETQDENQILHTEENDLSSMNSNENEPVATADEEQEAPTQLEKDIFNLQCTTNQYVWVPVENISDLYGVDPTGKLWGKLYTFSTSSPNKRPYNWAETEGVMNISDLTSRREPDIVTNYDYESSYLKSSLNGITQHKFLQEELEQFFYTTIESIKKYGGFYIGRYETGGLNGKAVVRKMDTNIASQTWYTMYKKCKTLGIENPSVTTSMIWGTLWDETLDWFMKSGAVLNDGTQMTYSLICSNSTTWGNYYNATFDYYSDSNMAIAQKAMSTSTRIPAGSAERTKVNNIYDIAGNVWDWTLEANSSYSRVFRGGYFVSDGSYYPSSYRYSYYPVNSVNYRRLSCPTFN